MSTEVERDRGLEREGIRAGRVHWNLPIAALYEEAVRRDEGVIAAEGPLVCRTGQHTGRSPNDKFVVRDAMSEATVDWGKVNRPIDEQQFDALHRDILAALAGKELFVLDCFAGADPKYRLPVRVINEYAWHNLFCRNLFIDDPAAAAAGAPQFTVIDAPGVKANPKHHGSNSDVMIAVNFRRKLVLIVGTSYAGEMKKSIFTVLNYILPLRNVLSMHCSANVGPAGDVALFFGLSGTGKTTLSSDPGRMLIGDDEHGWSDRGIFNFEGGCYAKTIRLSKEAEPEIYATTRMFGTVLENVVMDPQTREVDFDDGSLAENTRACYPIDYIPNASSTGMGGQPRNVVMLTYDAFGVLPPIARLTPAQAAYYFLSGYTAKVAGTEIGVKEPQATFSTCFGAPFMPLHPTVYSKLLAGNIARYDTNVWLMNTGYTGGPYGVGQRMSIQHTRALLNAALDGKLEKVRFVKDAIFGFEIPTDAPGVPAQVLNPRETWKDKTAYDEKAHHLARLFIENFKQFADQASSEVLAAAPKAG